MIRDSIRSSVRPLRLAMLGCLLATLFLATPGLAQIYDIDYIGFGWEDGGIPPSVVGDQLYGTMVADYVDPAFGVNLGTEELTFHVYDLISAGQVDYGGGYLAITYTGGTLDIYRDPLMNAAWGINPPNATSPGSFTEGTLFFRGSFTSFQIFFTPGGDGSYEGSLDGVAGEILDTVCTDCVYTWGGTFLGDSGATIPEGYDMQMDGVFEIDAAVPNEPTSWGSVKALFK